MAHKVPQEDVILPITNDWMQKIISREKTYEFRRYRLASSVKRAWFYLNAPLSHIEYVCEIDPARTRGPGQEPLPEDGIGNKSFNEFHKESEKWDFAYRIRSAYRLSEPIKLADMKGSYGIKLAPRGRMYTPNSMIEAIKWREEDCIWSDVDGPVSSCEKSLVDTDKQIGTKRGQEQEPSARPIRKRRKTEGD